MSTSISFSIQIKCPVVVDNGGDFSIGDRARFSSGVLASLQRIASRIALDDDSNTVSIDTVHGHLWASQDREQCLCGLFLKSESIEFVEIAAMVHSVAGGNVFPLPNVTTNEEEVKSVKKKRSASVMDSFAIRERLYETAIEVAFGLAAVGAVCIAK